MSDSLREELEPGRLILSLTAGLILGVMDVVLASSFAALIFTGQLADRLSDGVSAWPCSRAWSCWRGWP